jgi:hypothetical protein
MMKLYHVITVANECGGCRDVAFDWFRCERGAPRPYAEVIENYDPGDDMGFAEGAIDEMFTEAEAVALKAYLDREHGGAGVTTVKEAQLPLSPNTMGVGAIPVGGGDFYRLDKEAAYPACWAAQIVDRVFCTIFGVGNGRAAGSTARWAEHRCSGDRGMRKKREPRLNAAAPEQEKRAIPPALAAHSWRPGQSGNPGGRTPEFVDCQRLCREASPEAARRLIGLMYSEDERIALMAADKVLDRAWGRPKEPDQPTSLAVAITRRRLHKRRSGTFASG